MEKSFRAILSEFLEENEPAKPVSPSSAAPEMSFFWQSPLPKTAPKKNSYPTSRAEKTYSASEPTTSTEPLHPANATGSARSANATDNTATNASHRSSESSAAESSRHQATPAEPKKSEIVDNIIKLSSLSVSDRNLTQILILIGATELKDGVSEQLLKKAHRRLAKRLHPDMQSSSSPLDKERNQQLFMSLQSAYEPLLESLSTYKTDQAKAA